MEEMWNMKASATKSSTQPSPSATNQVSYISEHFSVIWMELFVG